MSILREGLNSDADCLITRFVVGPDVDSLRRFSDCSGSRFTLLITTWSVSAVPEVADKALSVAGLFHHPLCVEVLSFYPWNMFPGEVHPTIRLPGIALELVLYVFPHVLRLGSQELRKLPKPNPAGIYTVGHCFKSRMATWKAYVPWKMPHLF